MPRSSLANRLIVAILAIGLLLPIAAQARAGMGFSGGSRGSRSYYAPAPTRLSPSSAAPLAPGPAIPYAPSYQPRPRSSLMTGLMAGFAGAMLGHMLFGGNAFGGLLGFLLEVGLIVLIVRWLLSWLATRQVRGGGVGMPPRTGSLQLQQNDFTQFSRLLADIQSAWSDRDPTRLRMLTTPDMLLMFEDQLASLTRAGRRNMVSDVHLLQGDLSEAWVEGAREYATVAMRYAMRDVTYDQTGRIVDGTPNETVTVTELWTFVRGSGGGNWILSAIQQPR